MKDDYLWDRSGKPDAEIQELEEILGELRYDPRPLEILAQTHVGRSRRVFPGLAIAAAIAMIVLGLGLWLGMQRARVPEVTKTNSQPAGPENSTRAAASPVDEKKLSGLLASAGTEPNKPKRQLGGSSSRRTLASNRVRRTPAENPALAAKERMEAEAAKERLMVALRLASTKLNVAQRRMQGGSTNQVNNQHKIG